MAHVSPSPHRPEPEPSLPLSFTSTPAFYSAADAREAAVVAAASQERDVLMTELQGILQERDSLLRKEARLQADLDATQADCASFQATVRQLQDAHVAVRETAGADVAAAMQRVAVTEHEASVARADREAVAARLAATEEDLRLAKDDSAHSAAAARDAESRAADLEQRVRVLEAEAARRAIVPPVFAVTRPDDGPASRPGTECMSDREMAETDASPRVQNPAVVPPLSLMNARPAASTYALVTPRETLQSGSYGTVPSMPVPAATAAAVRRPYRRRSNSADCLGLSAPLLDDIDEVMDAAPSERYWGATPAATPRLLSAHPSQTPRQSYTQTPRFLAAHSSTTPHNTPPTQSQLPAALSPREAMSPRESLSPAATKTAVSPAKAVAVCVEAAVQTDPFPEAGSEKQGCPCVVQ